MAIGDPILVTLPAVFNSSYRPSLGEGILIIAYDRPGATLQLNQLVMPGTTLTSSAWVQLGRRWSLGSGHDLTGYATRKIPISHDVELTNGFVGGSSRIAVIQGFVIHE